jgi:hypothetical protein
MKTFAIVKRQPEQPHNGKQRNPYEAIVIRGFNHTAASICQRGDNHICVMMEGRGIIPMDVAERYSTHVVLKDQTGNKFGMVFENV